MTNIKDKILSEVDAIAPGYVQVMAEMMEECPTLKGLVEGKISTDSEGVIWHRLSDEVQRTIKEHR